MLGKQSWWEFRQTESFLNKEPAFALYVGLKLWVKYSASEIFLGKFFFSWQRIKNQTPKKRKKCKLIRLEKLKTEFCSKTEKTDLKNWPNRKTLGPPL